MTPAGTAPDPVTVLAGDIGGTNARLAQVEVAPGGRARIVREATFPSNEFPGLAPIITQFLQTVADDVESACMAVAGPVLHGRLEATNLPWVVDEAELAADTGIPRVLLINDFAAIGHGITRLEPDDVVTVKAGLPDPDGTIAVIGPGTGLGHGFIAGVDGRRVVLPSEAGHAGFAPADEVEWELLRHLRRRYGHASWERVVSGPGIVNVYRFLAGRPGATERLDVRAAMEREDPAAVVTRYALEGADPLCVEALDRVIRAFATQAGNFALAVYATGGVFIAGGIAPRIVSKLRHPSFAEAFENKGRFRDFLQTVPVHLVTDTRVGLRGAAALAARTHDRSSQE